MGKVSHNRKLNNFWIIRHVQANITRWTLQLKMIYNWHNNIHFLLSLTARHGTWHHVSSSVLFVLGYLVLSISADTQLTLFYQYLKLWIFFHQLRLGSPHEQYQSPLRPDMKPSIMTARFIASRKLILGQESGQQFLCWWISWNDEADLFRDRKNDVVLQLNHRHKEM